MLTIDSISMGHHRQRVGWRGHSGVQAVHNMPARRSYPKAAAMAKPAAPTALFSRWLWCSWVDGMVKGSTGPRSALF
jgi:hypothetical protein